MKTLKTLSSALLMLLAASLVCSCDSKPQETLEALETLTEDIPFDLSTSLFDIPIVNAFIDKVDGKNTLILVAETEEDYLEDWESEDAILTFLGYSILDTKEMKSILKKCYKEKVDVQVRIVAEDEGNNPDAEARTLTVSSQQLNNIAEAFVQALVEKTSEELPEELDEETTLVEISENDGTVRLVMETAFDEDDMETLQASAEDPEMSELIFSSMCGDSSARILFEPISKAKKNLDLVLRSSSSAEEVTFTIKAKNLKKVLKELKTLDEDEEDEE